MIQYLYNKRKEDTHMAQTYVMTTEMTTLLQGALFHTLKSNEKHQDDGGKELTHKTRHDSAKGYNGKVDPIKDQADIERAKEYFLSQNLRFKSNHTNIRNYMLFILGLNTGRRVGDILQFTIGDFLYTTNKVDGKYVFKKYIKHLKEQKTGKHIDILINDSCKEAIARYLDTLDTFKLTDYLFLSRKGGHIQYNQALRIYKQMANEIGLTEKGLNIGTHSARKTLGYNWMKKAENRQNPLALSQLQKFYNHTSNLTTLSYIGLEQEEQDKMLNELNL